MNVQSTWHVVKFADVYLKIDNIFNKKYATAGFLSPVMLIGLRFLQGAALGGEWAGAVLLSLEHGEPTRRGRNGSWAQMGPSIGVVIASGTVALTTWLIPEEQFAAWGWRIPLLASLLLVAFGLWVRLGLTETPPVPIRSDKSCHASSNASSTS